MAGTSVITLDGAEIQSAPVMGRDCSWPLTDLRLKEPNDSVVEKFPTFIGWWEDDIEAPSIVAQAFDVNTSAIAGACDMGIVTSSLTSCDYVVPNMRLVSMKSDNLLLEDLLKPLCRQRGVNLESVANVVFDSNGRIRQGQPYTMNLVRSALSQINHVLKHYAAKNVTNGDAAQDYQVDGLYTQLDGGWTAGDVDCGDQFNLAQAIDWGDLCGVAGPTSPDDLTIAAKTVTLWGTVYSVPVGLNLAQFIERLWLPAVVENYIQRDDEIQWEMHVRSGEDYCIRNTVTCMQPCSNDSNFDNEVRDRWIGFHNSDIMRLVPSNETFALQKSPRVPSNTMYFGPRSIGGNPTYATFFQNLSGYWGEIPRFESISGTGFGSAPRDPLHKIDRTRLINHFDEMAFMWDVKKSSPLCYEVAMLMKQGTLVMGRHLWLKLTNVLCENFINVPAPNITVTAV